MDLIEDIKEVLGLNTEDLIPERLETYVGWSAHNDTVEQGSEGFVNAQAQLSKYMINLDERFTGSDLQGQIIKGVHTTRFQIVDLDNPIDPYTGEKGTTLHTFDVDSAKSIVDEYCANQETQNNAKNEADDVNNEAQPTHYPLPSCTI